MKDTIKKMLCPAFAVDHRYSVVLAPETGAPAAAPAAADAEAAAAGK